MVSGGACTQTVQCNSDSSCTTCPLGYTLNAGTCSQCTASNCLRCNFGALTQCTLCNISTFLDTANNLCAACTSPCLTCQTSTVCTTCADGFFMQTLNNLPTGKCIACDSNCATCAKSPTYCLTCPTGSSLVAVKCLSNQNVGFNMTFSSPTATSSAAEL